MKKIGYKLLLFIQISLFFCSIVIINITYYKSIISNKIIETSGKEYVERENYIFSNTFFDENDYIEQIFHPQYSNLKSIKIRLALNYAGLSDDFILLIELYEEYNIIKQEEVNNNQFENWKYYNFIVEEELDVNKNYSIKIRQLIGPKRENSEEFWISYVIFHTEEHIKENEYYYFYNGEEIEGEFEVVYIYSYLDYKLILKQIMVNILFICSIIGFYILKRKIRISSNIKKRIAYIIYFLLPIVTFFLVECITGNIFNINGESIVKNLIIYYLLLFILSLIFRSIGKLSIIYMGIFVSLALVQYFVLLFRGRVFTIQDIYSWKTAATVANTYVYEIPYSIFVVLMILLYFIFICRSLKINIFSRIKIFIFISSIIFIILIIKNINNGYLYKIDMWNIEDNYKSKGFLLTLISEIPYLVGEKPEEYDIKKVKSIIEKVDFCNMENSVTVPENIILIMNESFADLEYINEISTDRELLPYIKKMDENVIKGYLNVSVFGGGTANTEYEVLIGNSINFLVAGTTAYEMNVFSKEYGLASTLKSQGYNTIAIHPFLAKNWNRKTVYQYMEFDRFLSEENLGKMQVLRWCVSDKSVYERLIDIYNEKEGSLFSFLVTMQNHGGYATEWDDLKDTIKLNYENNYPQTEQYLSLLQESDKAFHELIEYFSSIEESTMIIMFGDHQASIEEGFYEELFEKKLEELSFEEKQERYVTPFIIWTNYDIEEKYDIRMSANYFGSYILSITGLELTPYNRFLLNLWNEIPIIGYGGICDKYGIWYQWDEIPEYYAKLIEEYKILQYNYVYDRSNRIDEIFTVK